MTDTIQVPLSGYRDAVLAWPTADPETGVWTSLLTLLGAPMPLTMHYPRGPVPFVEVRKAGTAPAVPLRVYLGDTLPIPSDGTDWQIRPAYDPHSISYDRPTTNVAHAMVQHDCHLLFDVPPGYFTAGDFHLDHQVTVNNGDGLGEFLVFPARGIRIFEEGLISSPTWPGAGALTAQFDNAVQTFPPIGTASTDFINNNWGAAIAAASTRRSALVGEINLVNVGTYDISQEAPEFDVYRHRVAGGGTGGEDYALLTIRGTRRAK